MNLQEQELVDRIESKFGISGRIQRKRRMWVSIESYHLIETCMWLKEEGFDHLSAISVTDWIEEGTYELTYHLWSYEHKILLTVKTMISRDKPVIDSVTPIWNENAQIHERELHELFGVKFDGNEDLSPLFLEDWAGPPPFRKDFDWREYVCNEFYDPENEREQAYYA
mgnify:CR=1 FL=1